MGGALIHTNIWLISETSREKLIVFFRVSLCCRFEDNWYRSAFIRMDDGLKQRWPSVKFIRKLRDYLSIFLQTCCKKRGGNSPHLYFSRIVSFTSKMRTKSCCSLFLMCRLREPVAKAQPLLFRFSPHRKMRPYPIRSTNFCNKRGKLFGFFSCLIGLSCGIHKF